MTCFRSDLPGRRPGAAASSPLRLLAFVMALVLLTVRFGTYSDELFVTPVEDAIFDVAFVVADAEGKQTKPPAIKSKQVLDCVLLPDQVAAPRPVMALPLPPEHTAPFFFDDVAGEIFVPPEAAG